MRKLFQNLIYFASVIEDFSAVRATGLCYATRLSPDYIGACNLRDAIANVRYSHTTCPLNRGPLVCGL